ncbi:MAG: hypothetical protein GDA40_11660 [Rhodobacteraceae bacterium]|nr:hypothetical protein [Paracoccaceae bacterium]
MAYAAAAGATRAALGISPLAERLALIRAMEAPVPYMSTCAALEGITAAPIP